jgi:hypothetical protein
LMQSLVCQAEQFAFSELGSKPSRTMLIFWKSLQEKIQLKLVTMKSRLE